MIMILKVPFDPAGPFGSSPRIPKKVKMNGSDLALASSQKIWPLKQVWKTDLGIRPDKIARGNQDRFYVVPRNEESVVLGVNSDGKVDGEFRCSGPYTVGEGKDRVYVASKQQQLTAFDKSGNKVWVKNWPKNSNYYYSSSSYPSNPFEDRQGNVWFNDDKTVYRFSNDGQTMDKVYIAGWGNDKKIEVDSKGNAYTNNSDFVRVAPDMTMKKINGDSHDIFLAHDLPFVIQGDKLYKLNFDENPPKDKVEILHWNSDKKPMKPVVGKNGDIHLVLRANNDKSGLYIVLSPVGIPLVNGQTKYVKSRRTLNFGVQDVDPVVTPGGTVYVVSRIGESWRDYRYELRAVDRNGNQHSMPLGKEEPAGLSQFKGEKVAVTFKDGTVVGVQAKSTQEIMKELKQEEMDRQTLEDLGQQWPR